MPRGRPTIGETVLRLVHERGPQHLDALVPEIVGAGLTRAKDPRRAVLAAIDINPEFLRDWEGRWCSLANQLEGAIFTHRPTSLERREEIVMLIDDLHLIERFAIRPRRLVPAGEVHLDYVGDFFELPWIDDVMDPDDLPLDLDPDVAAELTGFLREIGVPYEIDDSRALLEFLDASRFRRLLDGPPGWLPRLAADDLLGIRVREGAIETLAVGRREVQAPHAGIVAAQVAKLARRMIGPDASWFGPPAIEIVDLLRLVATEAPELFRRPLPPFSEVVSRGGLEVVNGLVGHPGTNWAALGWLPEDRPQEAWGFRPAMQVQ